MKNLLSKSEQLDCEKIVLSARESAINFYKKHGFLTFGEKYASSKTGVIHIEMMKK